MICQRRIMPTSSTAFTLIEVLIAISILAVLIAVATISINAAQPDTLSAVARTLAADLRLAREFAIQHNGRWTVTFSLEENSYTINHPDSPGDTVFHPATGADITTPALLHAIGTTTTGDNAVRFRGAGLSESLTRVNSITFLPSGGTGPDRVEDTLIVLSTGVNADMRQIRLTVSWTTGQIWVGNPEGVATTR